MLKKPIIALLCAVGISTTAFAANAIIENHRIKEEISDFVSNDSVELNIEKNFTQKAGLKKAESFASIVDCFDRAKYENISAYITFMCENDFTFEQIKQINKILESGVTVQSLKQVYEFWLSTDEDFSVISEICSLEDEFFSEFWYEDAFNFLTDNEHGVLNADDVNSYVEKGIDLDTILAANTLSRKKGQNIFDILDSIADGESIDEQIKEIYGVNAIPDSESDSEKVNQIIKAKRYKVPSDVFKSRFADLDGIVKQAETAYTKLIDQKITSELKRLKVSEPEVSSREDTELMEECEYPISVKRALMNKGYTPQEIQKSEHMGMDDIYTSVKKAMEEMKNEK